MSSGTQVVFKVEDNSMEPDRIIKGDNVIVKPAPSLWDANDILLLYTDTYKLLRRVLKIEGERYLLMASNPVYHHLICKEIHVVGTVVRNYITY